MGPEVAADRVRLFVALELPAAVRDVLADWSEVVARDVRGLRPTGADSLHVTLAFLGEQPVTEVAEIAQICTISARFPAAELELADVEWLPPRRPRVLAVRLDDPSSALARLRSALVEELTSGGFLEPERRPFLAHATVARARSGLRPPRQSPPPPQRLRFIADSVSLWRSRLGSGPARYESLCTVRLAAQQR